jgi:hypothetical protein
MLGKLPPRTRSAFESRTQVWLTGLRKMDGAHAKSNGSRQQQRT